MTFCEKNDIFLDITKNSNSNNCPSSALRKTERAHSNITSNNIKNEINGKVNKALEMLNNVNNKKYTMKYIEEKIKHKNLNINDNYNFLFNNNKNISPINNFKNYNKNASYLNKANNVLKNNQNKNKSNKKKYDNNNVKKEKGNNDINGYKINNLSSSFNNNYTNIKTNKIVFIDLKNNNDIINQQNNDNQNEFKLNINDKYLNNLRNNDISTNNKMLIKSSRNKAQNDSILGIQKLNNINNIHNCTYDNNIINNKKLLNNSRSNLNKNSHFIFKNLQIQKSDEFNIKNNIHNNITKKDIKNNIQDKQQIKKNTLQELKKSKNLTNKELSYYILSKSPILRLCERMIFSRSTRKIRNILPKETIFNDNKIILENKIIELKEKIVLCNKILDTPFTASKTADITLNFITSFQEDEFKGFPILLTNDEEKKYYLNYIKILYYLSNETIENNENNEEDDIIFLRYNLYLKLNNKGYKSIRDYLYNVFIKKKSDIKEIPKIAEINYLLSQSKDIFEINKSIKMCKFISFTIYLMKEIVHFGNNIKSTLELKRRIKNVIDIVFKKLDKYQK